MKKNVAVFFGGISVEREVSVITGVLTLNSIDRKKYNPVPVFIDETGVWYTGEELFEIENYKEKKFRKIKRVSLILGDDNLYVVGKRKLKKLFEIAVGINCLHGEAGEDGSLSGVLKCSFIPSASPQALPSALFMDKSATKVFLKGMGVKTLPCFTVRATQNVEEEVKKIAEKGFPLIVKPACSGSSVGISKVNDERELFRAVGTAFKYGEKVVIERCLENFTEINCAVYRNANGEVVSSECERPVGKEEVLSFSDKYKCGSREFPANISPKIRLYVKKTAEKIYERLIDVGTVRLDFMVKGQDVYLNEVNTVPGSLAYYLFCDTLKDFSRLLDEQIALSERNFARNVSLNRKIDCELLDIKGVKGSKRL